MLTATNEAGASPMPTTLPADLHTPGQAANRESASGGKRGLLGKVLRVEWLGQTAASLCWIASVFVYGISSAGDWLQLGAASAWLLANLAAAVTSEAD